MAACNSAGETVPFGMRFALPARTADTADAYGPPRVGGLTGPPDFPPESHPFELVASSNNIYPGQVRIRGSVHEDIYPQSNAPSRRSPMRQALALLVLLMLPKSTAFVAINGRSLVGVSHVRKSVSPVNCVDSTRLIIEQRALHMASRQSVSIRSAPKAIRFTCPNEF